MSWFLVSRSQVSQSLVSKSLVSKSQVSRHYPAAGFGSGLGW